MNILFRTIFCEKEFLYYFHTFLRFLFLVFCMSSIFLESETFGFGNDSFADLESLYNSSKTEKNHISSEGEQEKIHKKTEQNIVKNFSPKKISQKSHAPLEVISRSESLKSLLLSMKPSFLKRDENPENIRQIFLCNDTENAMFLLRK